MDFVNQSCPFLKKSTEDKENVALDLGWGPLLGVTKRLTQKWKICTYGKGVFLPFLTLAAYFLAHS